MNNEAHPRLLRDCTLSKLSGPAKLGLVIDKYVVAYPAACGLFTCGS